MNADMLWPFLYVPLRLNSAYFARPFADELSADSGTRRECQDLYKIIFSACIPIQGGRRLRPVKTGGREEQLNGCIFITLFTQFCLTGSLFSFINLKY